MSAAEGGGGRRRRRGGQEMVPEATFDSYYGRPVIKPPVWEELDIAGYLFLGGAAGGSSLLAAGAELTGRPAMARVGKLCALGGISLSAVALVHDLGRPSRFYNMLRVFKPSSPMSVGSWLLAGFGPAAGVAALSDLTGVAARIGRAATYSAAILGSAVASYTAVLIADTAVPAWHQGWRELPFVFVSSGAAAAAGLALAGTPVVEAAPARRLALGASVAESVLRHRMQSGMGMAAEPFEQGRAGRLLRAADAFTGVGAALGAVVGRRRRWAAVAGGLCLVAGSACTRFGIFAAGVASAEDPKYTVDPQRDRLSESRPGAEASEV